MGTPFDHEKALREEVAGMGDIVSALGKRASVLEGRYTEAEAEFLAVNKLLGYARGELARKRAVLQEMEQGKQQ